MLTGIARLYARLVLDHAVLVLLLLTVIGLLFAYQTRYFKLDASADSLVLETDRDLREFREVSRRYTTREFLFVAFTPNEDLFAPRSLNAVAKLATALSGLDRVHSVVSLLEVPLVNNVEGSLSDIEDNLRTLASDDVDMARAREELTTSPVYRDLVVSADGRTTALQINLKERGQYAALRDLRNRLRTRQLLQGLEADERQQLRQVTADYDAAKTRADGQRHEDIAAIRSIIGDFAADGALYLGGIPMIADDMITFIRRDLATFGIGVFAFLVIMLWTIFRRLRWVLLPLASCAYAGLVMIGMLGLAGWRVTVISSNFISLMLIITMSMNIHLVVRYRQLARDFPDMSQRELVLNATRKMVWPCLYTALTTIIAFASLVVSDIKPVIDFGWMMTIGLTVTFVTSFTLFPALLVKLQRIETPSAQGRQFQFTALLANFTVRHNPVVLGLSALLMVLSVVGIGRLQVENSFINYFSEDTEIYQGMKLIDEQLGGTTPLDVIVRFPEASAATIPAGSGDDELDELDDLDDLLEEEEQDRGDQHWFTPVKIEQVKRVHDYLDALPEVGKVLSLAALIRMAESLNDGEPFSGIELALMYKRIPDDLKRTMLNPYVSVADNEARISLRIVDSAPDLRRQELLERIETDLSHKVGLAPENVSVTGILVLYNNMLQSLFRSQIMTLGAVMLGVALMLLVLFRSVQLAIIGIIPNVLAALAILGLMGWLGIPLDMMTITIAAITIGIAVDNSIHYIYRFREEFPRHGDYASTLHYCHANIGKAVFYTAVTIIVGFSILVLSNFIPTIYFGLFTALAMAVALLAALTLLPGLIMLWKPFRN